MSNWNLRMCRHFKFNIISQIISIVTWVRAAKLNLKIPIRPENINKMEIEFPQSGMHTPPERKLTPSFQGFP